MAVTVATFMEVGSGLPCANGARAAEHVTSFVVAISGLLLSCANPPVPLHVLALN